MSPRCIAWAVCAAAVLFVAHRSLRLQAPVSAPPVKTAPVGLAVPAVPTGFGGAAVGETLDAPPAYTNEALQKRLKAERARMGIQRIITPNPVVRRLQSMTRGLAYDARPGLGDESSPVPVDGKTAMLLSPAP